MIPVDDGRICMGSQPTALAASAHIRRASRTPWAPVHALAFPALTTTPLRWPPAMCSRPTSIGAAKTLLVVNTAAAAAGLALVLIPAETPAARKPRGESRCNADMGGKYNRRMRKLREARLSRSASGRFAGRERRIVVVGALFRPEPFALAANFFRNGIGL